MKQTRETLFVECVNKAKQYAEDRYGCGSCPREWLSSELMSYDDSKYRVETHVLEGSPPKGCVVADRTTGMVRVFGVRMRIIKTFKAFGPSYCEV
jgi:hypothetical protein